MPGEPAVVNPARVRMVIHRFPLSGRLRRVARQPLTGPRTVLDAQPRGQLAANTRSSVA